MSRPSFFEGVAVALAAGLAGAVAYTALAWALPAAPVTRVVIAGLGLAYVLYLLARSGERVGRITTLGAWLAAASLLWLLGLPLVLYLIAHLGVLWLVRSIYFHAGVLPALADLGLTGAGLAAGTWAAIETGSVFLVIWSFFLVQALFVVLPRGPGMQPARAGADAEDPFDRAHRAAQAALRRLSYSP